MNGRSSGRPRLKMPSKDHMIDTYSVYKSIKLSSQHLHVGAETFRKWLLEYDIPIAKQGVRRNRKSKPT